MAETDDAFQWQGRTMIGSDGEKIGKVSHIYEDPATGIAEWATVASGLFGTKSHFVPLAGSSRAGEDIRAQVTKAQVKDAPGVSDDDDLSEEEERRLFEYYGVPYSTGGTTTAEGSPRAAGADDAHQAGGPAQADQVGAGRSSSPAQADQGRADQVPADPSSPPAQTEREPAGGDVEDPARQNETSRPVPGPGGRQPEGGRRRLRRYVVTEVTTTVPVSDEETEIEGGPTDSTGR